MSELQRVLADVGFHLSETGGGLTAYTRQESDGSLLLLTRAEDAEAPGSLEDACTLGRETPDGSWELVGHGDDVRVAVRLAQRLT